MQSLHVPWLLRIILHITEKLAFAQVLITDDPATNTSANNNALLDLKSESKPIIIPVLHFDNLPENADSEYGMFCVTTGLDGFDLEDFHRLRFYWDGPGGGQWARVLTTHDADLGSLTDVHTKGIGIHASYYIGELAAPNANDNGDKFNTAVGYSAGISLNASGPHP